MCFAIIYQAGPFLQLLPPEVQTQGLVALRLAKLTRYVHRASLCVAAMVMLKKSSRKGIGEAGDVVSRRATRLRRSRLASIQTHVEKPIACADQSRGGKNVYCRLHA